MLAAAQLGVGWCRCGSSSYAGRPVGDALDYIVVRQARVELTVPLDDGRITLLAAACVIELGRGGGYQLQITGASPRSGSM